MSEKPETRFRSTQVWPFLKRLPNSHWTPIQQVSRNGDLDYIGCVRGKYVALELKADKKSPVSELQKYNSQKIHQCGGFAIIVTPENWDDTKYFLNYLSKGG